MHNCITSDTASFETIPQKLRLWQCQHCRSVQFAADFLGTINREIFKTENSEAADSASLSSLIFHNTDMSLFRITADDICLRLQHREIISPYTVELPWAG